MKNNKKQETRTKGKLVNLNVSDKTYEINLNIPLIGLDGLPNPGITLGMVLSELLGTEVNGDGFYEWFRTLLAKKPIIVNELEFEFLFNLVKTSPRLLVFSRGQLVEVFGRFQRK